MNRVNQKFYLAFIADNSSNDLLIVSSGDGKDWSDNQQLGVSSSLAPALAVWNNALALAFVADDGSNDLMFITSKR